MIFINAIFQYCETTYKIPLTFIVLGCKNYLHGSDWTDPLIWWMNIKCYENDQFKNSGMRDSPGSSYILSNCHNLRAICIKKVVLCWYPMKSIPSSPKWCQSSGLDQPSWSWFGMTLQQTGHMSTWSLFTILKMDIPAHPPPCYTNRQLYKQQIHRGIDSYQFRQERNLGSAMKPQSAQISVTEIKRRFASLPEAHHDPHSSVLPLFDFYRCVE